MRGLYLFASPGCPQGLPPLPKCARCQPDSMGLPGPKAANTRCPLATASDIVFRLLCAFALSTTASQPIASAILWRYSRCSPTSSVFLSSCQEDRCRWFPSSLMQCYIADVLNQIHRYSRSKTFPRPMAGFPEGGATNPLVPLWIVVFTSLRVFGRAYAVNASVATSRAA
jgi:hypothetical protein